jgi:hypothetical protein
MVGIFLKKLDQRGIGATEDQEPTGKKEAKKHTVRPTSTRIYNIYIYVMLIYIYISYHIRLLFNMNG